MEDPEETMTTGDVKNDSSTSGRSKAKKRSLVERELETNLTAKITSPLGNRETTSTSRYGRARKLKIGKEALETKKTTPEVLKTQNEKSPIKPQSPVYKMHASNSPIKTEPKKPKEEPQTENQQENIKVNGTDDSSPENNTPKIFVRKDILKSDSKDKLPKNIFSPKKSQKINDHLNNLLERTSANFKMTKTDYIDNSSVVKTLDFDSKKKKKENKETKPNVVSQEETTSKEVVKETITSPKHEVDLETQCSYQVGDLAWARMGTYPFWPCIITRDPLSGTFCKKKLFGRVERNVLHVTFFGDNGRRSWIVENMLRTFMGLAEFQMTKEQFTSEDKKKDPKLYASFSISEKKQPLWMTSVEEAEMLLREPKRLRIDLLHEMLVRSRALKHLPKGHKSGKISRADSDVSLSESLYDTLFSEDDGKPDEVGSSSRKKSLDVSEVVTACLDNMAAKTGITKIQKQSHMDRWLQKAKSKTPEKTQVNALVNLVEQTDCSSKSKERVPNECGKSYSLRKSKESQCLLGSRSEHDYSKFVSDDESTKEDIEKSKNYEYISLDESGRGIGIISKVESLADENYNVNKEIPCDNVDENSEDTELFNRIPESNDGIDNDIPLSDSDAMSYDDCVQLGDENSCNEKVTLEHKGSKNNNLDKNKDDSSEESPINCNKEILGSTEKNTEKEKDVSETNETDEENMSVISETYTETESGIINEEDVENVSETNDNDADNISETTETGAENRSEINEKDGETASETFETDTDNLSEINEKDGETALETNEKDTDNLSEINEKDAENIPDSNEKDEQNEIECSENSNEKILETQEDEENTSSSKDVENISVINEKDAENTTACEKVEDLPDINEKDTQNVSEANLRDEDLLENKQKEEENASEINEKNENVSDVTPVDEEHGCLNNLADNSNVDDDDDDDLSSDDVSSVELVWSPITVPGNSDDEKDMLEDDIKDLEDKQPNTDFNDELKTESITKQNIDKFTNYNNQKIPTENKIIKDTVCDIKTSSNKATDAFKGSELKSHDTEKKNGGISNLEDECSDLAVNEPSKTKDLDLYSNKKSECKVKTRKAKDSAAENIDNIDRVNISVEHKFDKDIDSFKRIKSKENQSKTIPIVNEDIKCNGDESHELLNGDIHPETRKDKYATNNENCINTINKNNDSDIETASINSEDSEIAIGKIKSRLRQKQKKSTLDDPEFIQYLEMKQDTLMDEHPELNEQQIIEYLYKTWVYEKENETKKGDDSEHPSYVKGLEEVRRKPIRSTRVAKNKNKITKYIENEVESDLSDARSQSPIILEKRKMVTQEEIPKQDKTKEETAAKINNLDSENEYKKIEVKSSTEAQVNNSEVTNSLSRLRLKINASSLKSPKIDSPKSDIGESKSAVEKTKEVDVETLSIDSESSDVPLIHRKLRQRYSKEVKSPELKKSTDNYETASIDSEDSDITLAKRKQKMKSEKKDKNYDDPEFLKYLELRQDALIDENPLLTEDEIKNYLYNTWIYEESTKNELKKNDEIEQSSLIKGLNDEVIPPKKIKKQIRTSKHHITDYFERRDKPKRKSIKPYYNEEYSDDSGESFETNINNNIDKNENDRSDSSSIKSPKLQTEYNGDVDQFYEFQAYFDDLIRPKPNVFKGLIREKLCDICENAGRLVKCRGCNAMFHVDCVKKQVEISELTGPSRGRKKKKKLGRKPKNPDDLDNVSDDKIHDISEENVSMEEIEVEPLVVDADLFEREMEIKMKELLNSNEEIQYDCYSNEDSVLWANSIAGRCEIVNVQLKRRDSNKEPDYSDFKCNNCQKYDTPICFVCRSAVTKNGSSIRQRCHVAHCHKYYHLECLEHWPQTQLNSGEPSIRNKKVNQHLETLMCPRHVCHTCVSDDPRGCKTRFSGDKLARCIRCPATYHSFTKCIPAGTQIINASHIICPRHYENRSGKVSCHVNTGWCFICALGGSLICCEYCPTSFHAECLNIDPPEGGYMCEDCETGRLPLYGEMVWVKLGHYRWWPGIILHPCEIPENIMAVKHNLGEFVVRFFGQYDHYWVNRGRVFPFQEGDSGRISSQKSKIDAAFTMAMEHAQRACEIMKSAHENEEESSDIASSLLPPHYVKLKVNKPCGSLCGWKLDNPELSLTQCECGSADEDPCGPYSQCLNRMLLTECGPTCKTGERCNNRAFEKRQYPKLTPYRTSQRGWGLKTLEDIRAGQFVIEYVGELIDEEEFRRRMTRKHEIRDENFYFLTLDKERMIDAGPKGNLARFMNHCCEPNCETQKWTVLGDIRVGLFAINDIPANSEVTFNYNLESAGIEKKRCFCGAKRCSGYIGAKPKQDESQLKKPKRPYKKRKNEESPTTKPKPKRPLGRPPKPKPLTEIEKDLLIIKSATNDIQSDDNKISEEKKPVKRRRVSFTNEEINGESQSKKLRND